MSTSSVSLSRQNHTKHKGPGHGSKFERPLKRQKNQDSGSQIQQPNNNPIQNPIQPAAMPIPQRAAFPVETAPVAGLQTLKANGFVHPQVFHSGQPMPIATILPGMNGPPNLPMQSHPMQTMPMEQHQLSQPLQQQGTPVYSSVKILQVPNEEELRKAPPSPTMSRPSHQEILRQHNEEFKLKQMKKNAVQQASSRYAHYVPQDSFHFNFIIPALPLYLLDNKTTKEGP